VRLLLVAILLVLVLPPSARGEDVETIVKRLPNDGAECHYVLSLCSDADRAAATLARVRADTTEPEDARAAKVAAAEARVAKQVGLLTRAAAAVRARHDDTPDCFRRCARLNDDQ
jgi:hypothetical protein